MTETIRLRAMIFGIASPCGLCPWGLLAPILGATYFTLAYIRKNIDTIRLRALIFGHIVASTSVPHPSLFKLCPWDQNNPAPGSPESWSAFYRYLYVSFKQNSGEHFRATWPSCFI